MTLPAQSTSRGLASTQCSLSQPHITDTNDVVIARSERAKDAYASQRIVSWKTKGITISKILRNLHEEGIATAAYV